MKLIGLDVGTKRIGVAKADSSVCIAVPYSAIEVDGTELEKIASLARAWDINCFVIGLPRNNEGKETEQSKYSRAFADDLKQAIPDAKICFQDESLTSVEAEKRLKKRKKSYKKGDIDSEAATIILQDFLEEHTGKKAPVKTTKAAAAKRDSVKARKPHHFLTALLVILFLLVAAAGGAYGYYMYNLQPVITDVDCAAESDGSENEACQSTIFNVAEGTSVNDVAVNLKSANLIRDALVFQIYYRLNFNHQDIHVGDYDLNKSMTPEQILQALIRGGDANNTFSFTVFPGETVYEIKQKLAELGYDTDEIEAAFTAPYADESYSWIFEGRPEEAGLEGYLLGDTYEFYNTDGVETIVETMLTEMAKTLEEKNIKAGFEAQGLNLYQGITLASIVQKEANNAADQAKVAQIFYNRLGAEIPLGSDVTVIYAWDLANPGRDPNEVSNAEKLEIESPYNTRKNVGLPYGPISNPGVDALIAAAAPDQSMTDYVFFLTGDDGLMYYSVTEEEHNQNIIDHCQTLCGVAL